MSGGGDGVRLRPADLADASILWRWRNDPVTRGASFDDREISLEEHTRWMEATVRGHDRVVYVAEVHRAPVGTVRLDVTGTEAAVSVTVAPEWRGRGIGAACLAALCGDAFARRGLTRLTARIKADNRASRSVFERAGFARYGPDGDVLEFELIRPADGSRG
jgi:RimJ/RimL family protein N-acetyltransferase